MNEVLDTKEKLSAAPEILTEASQIPETVPRRVFIRLLAVTRFNTGLPLAQVEVAIRHFLDNSRL